MKNVTSHCTLPLTLKDLVSFFQRTMKEGRTPQILEVYEHLLFALMMTMFKLKFLAKVSFIGCEQWIVALEI